MTMKSTVHVLIVDDDPKIRDGLSRFLSEEGLHVVTARDGIEMRSRMAGGKVDIVILDVRLPGEDGISLLRGIRSLGGMPVILLTANAGETDRVVGLEIGADDYVCKPFSPRELLARIRVVLRRGNGNGSGGAASRTQVDASFRFEGWTLDARTRSLSSPDGAYVDLTSGEFDLLQAFVEHPNRVLSRDELLDLAKGRDSVVVDRSIDIQVMRLRRKIERDPQAPKMIKTLRNSGYLFTPIVTRGQP